MRYLVTGAAGFIGSNLVDRLLGQGHEVVGIDNLSTSTRDNLISAFSTNRFVLHERDLSQGIPIGIDGQSFDWVFHLSANVGVERVIKGVNRTISDNLFATHNILDFSRTNRIPIIFTSTSEIYGKNSKIPMHEEDDRLMGSASTFRWAYAETKVLDELLFKEFWTADKIPSITVRLFNTVGPRQSREYGMVLPRFVHQARNSLPISIYGDGLQTRSFCHVNDVINAMLMLTNNSKAYGSVFNVGSSSPITIIELAKLVKKLSVGSSSIIEHLDPKLVLGQDFEEIPNRLPDTSRIISLTGWKPTYTLERIILELLEAS